MKKNVFGLLVSIIIVLVVFGIIIMKKNITKKDDVKEPEISYTAGEFNLNLIKTVNKNNKDNYLISPYSIEIALNMLRDGASGDTKEEIDKVIGKREINNIVVKDRISIANAMFVRNEYKEYVKPDFYNLLSTSYDSEFIYDDFNTPEKINNWVKDKTSGMIDKILDEIDPDFVLGLANALAIDVKWSSQFSCESTTSEKFTKSPKEEIDVEMMHKTFDYGIKYLKNDSATGVIIPYKSYDSGTGEETFDDNNLNFIAILPNGNIDNYINNLTSEELSNLLNTATEISSKTELNLSLPRFKYDYELEDFKTVLKDLGIKLAFDEINADFTNIMPRNEEIENLYVGEAIHKTHIDLNEQGTKAAAVTYFGMYKNTSLPEEKEKINIKFNHPFAYIISDNTTGEMLFFGTVYNPNKWTGKTCDE